MRTIIACSVILALTLGVAAPSPAENMEQKCKDLVNKAVQLFQTKPKESEKLVNSPNTYVYREIYVFAMTTDNTVLAHPYDKGIIGRNMSDYFDDKTGKRVFQQFLDKATGPSGEGWVTYYWPRPRQKEKSYKRSFVKKVPGKNIYVAAGYYPLEKSE